MKIKLNVRGGAAAAKAR